MQRTLAVLAIVGLGAALAGGAQSLLAQGKTVWDAVYTDAQAKRGGEMYAQRCATCHAGDLRGAEIAPGLIGAEFEERWNDQPIAPLYELLRVTMPQDSPGSLTRPQAADVLAFMLNKGGFPAGDQELPFNTDALGQITYLAKKP